MIQAALDYAQQHKEANLQKLIELLAIPSISTIENNHAVMDEGAAWVRDYLQSIGLDKVEILPTDGYANVYGEWLGAGDDKPTLLLYGHYDVQPVEPLEDWISPPFEPTIRGDDIFARGAMDDKGQFFAILAAVDAYLKTSNALPINVKVLIEGEEEILSPNIVPFMDEHKEKLAADAVLVCDHPMLGKDLPMILYGVRGSCYFEITLRTARQDLHSGTYGGGVENPFNVLVRMMAQMQDAETRRILVPGFYDAVVEVSDEERALINNPIVTDDAIRHYTGTKQPIGEAGYTSAERISVRPTFEIHGMPGGYMGVGKKSIIPAMAQAKIGFRLVPNQDPNQIAELVMDYLYSLAPDTMEIDIHRMGGRSNPVVMDHTAPAVQAAAKAYQQVFPNPPLLMRGGGSEPITWDFQNTLGLPVVMMGFGLPDDNMHSPNEKFHLPNFYKAIETLIHYFAILAE